MNRYNLSMIMKTAWEIRRANSVNMSVAMKRAWALAKASSEETVNFTWVTPKGAKIEAIITVKHVTMKTVNADGWLFDTKCDEWFRTVESIKVNGKQTSMKEFSFVNGVDCIRIGYSGKNSLNVALPANVIDAVFGQERRERDARIERKSKIIKEYEDHVNAVYRMMNP